MSGSSSPNKKKQKHRRGGSFEEDDDDDDPGVDRAGLVILLRKCRNDNAMLRQRYRELLDTNTFLQGELDRSHDEQLPPGDAAAIDALVSSCSENLAAIAQKEIAKEDTTLFGAEQLQSSFRGFVNECTGPFTDLITRIVVQATIALGRKATFDGVDDTNDGDDETVDSWRQSKCIALCLAAMLEQLAGNQFRADCTVSFLLFLIPSVGMEHRDEVVKLFSKFSSGSIASMASINNILAKNDEVMRDITSPAAASKLTTVQCFDNGPASTAKTKKYISGTSRNTERQTSVVTFRMTLVLLDEDVPAGILANPCARIDPKKLEDMKCDELDLTPADLLVRADILTAYGARALQIIKQLGVDGQGDVMVGDAPPPVRKINHPVNVPRKRKASAAVRAPPGFRSVDGGGAAVGAEGAGAAAVGAGGVGRAVASAGQGTAGEDPQSTVRAETQAVMFVNPGSRETQDLVMNQCKIDHRVEGAEGVRSAEDDDETKPMPAKLVTLFSMDKGATPLGTALWDPQSIFLLCGLHVGFAMEHVIGSWLKEMDNAGAGTIPIGYGYSYPARHVLYGGGCDHHKFADFEDALTDSILMHFYSMAIKQRFSEGHPIDLEDDGALAELNDYVMQEGGGVRFESLKSFLLDVLLVQRGLRASTAAGPAKFEETCCWLKCAMPVFFAAGSHRMAPEVTYYLLLLEVLFKDCPDMLLVLKRTYSMRTESGASRNASFQCGDALMENRVQAAVRCTLSPSTVGVIRANYMSGGSARHNKAHVYKMLQVKQTPFVQRSKIQQYHSTLGVVRALNADSSGLYRDPEHQDYDEYKSLDGKQTKDASLAIHDVIAEGRERVHSFLQKLQSGERGPQIKISLFAQRDAREKKAANEVEKQQKEEEKAQELRLLDDLFAAEG